MLAFHSVFACEPTNLLYSACISTLVALALKAANALRLAWMQVLTRKFGTATRWARPFTPAESTRTVGLFHPNPNCNPNSSRPQSHLEWRVWFGLVWFGLVWFGLVWFGLSIAHCTFIRPTHLRLTNFAATLANSTENGSPPPLANVPTPVI